MTAVLPLASGSATEAAVLGILAGVSVLLLFAHLSRIPYPIWLTAGGAALAFVPGLPEIRLEPEIVLVAILPPLLYSAAFFSDLRELRRNARQVGLLAVGLVLATTFGIAAIAHALVPGLPWPSAIVLGAVLGPTDPVAATAIAGRVGVPRSVVSVLEGESLVNDATALIALKFAITAATAGSFSFGEAFGMFVLGVVGGVAVGVAVGWAVAQIRRRVDDMPTEAVLSIVTAYLAYLPAELLGVSGVIAAVTVGVYLGLRSPVLMNGNTRITVYGLWAVIAFTLNGLLFVLVGLQLPVVLDDLRGRDAGALALEAVAVAVGVMAIRFLWVFALTYGPRVLSAKASAGVPGCERAPSTVRAPLALAAAVAAAERGSTRIRPVDGLGPGAPKPLHPGRLPPEHALHLGGADRWRRGRTAPVDVGERTGANGGPTTRIALLRERLSSVRPGAAGARTPVGATTVGAPEIDARNVLVIAFTGMRGAVSLAAALTVPDDVVGRDLVVFLCFTTIVWTVVGQGLTLPTLLRRLGVRDDGSGQREEERARLLVAEAAVDAIEDLRDEDWVREDTADRVRGLHQFRRRRFLARLGQMDDDEPDIDGRSLAYQRLMHLVFDAQRAELLRLRGEALIGDETMRRIERDLDLEEERLDA